MLIRWIAIPAALAAPGPILAQVQVQASPFPVPCVRSIDDTAGSGCLEASSVPELGKLLPLSSDLFVEAGTGQVGIGTASPLARLDVNGSARLQDVDVTLGLDFLGTSNLQFPAVSVPGVKPMLSMFESGTANADRMVLGHSPGFSTWGLEYRDAGDQFVFKSSSMDVLNVDLANHDLALGSDTGSIRFPAASGTTSPMIEMFTSGTTNADRMVIAHSPAFGTWGLEYRDSSDQFAFRNSVDAVLTIELTPGPDEVLSLRGDPNFDLLDLHTAKCSGFTVPPFDLIEASAPTPIICSAPSPKFRVDNNGNVFADGSFTGPADFAEMIRATTGAASVEPGDVLEIDPASPRGVRRSQRAHSTLVAGVYSTDPGFVGSEREWDEPAPEGSREALAGESLSLTREDMALRLDEIPMAVVGIVPCKVSAESGPIEPGDLLVTSRTPGHAMRAIDPEVGTVVGKALEPLAHGTGQVRILVTLQ